jgi:hypothetical protein
VLAAQPASVSAARRFVRRALAGLGAPLVEDAALVVTELVSNAVLHASGPITLAVDRVGDGTAFRIAVGDASRVPPMIREYGTGAATGRGLNLVASVSRRWGVEHGGDGGKVVWAEIPTVRAPEGSGGRDASAPTSTIESSTSPATGARPVAFVGVPVDVYLRLQEQNDAVLRELELLAFTADHEGDVDPSPQLVEVIERSRRYFNQTREGFRTVVSAAAERGEAVIDLRGAVPVTGIAPSADLVGLFEQAEELARSGELLIGPADEDVARLRRWFVDELTAQLLEGHDPRPFSR